MSKWLGALVVAVGLDGCCTEAGCLGSVEVQVGGNVPDVFSVDLADGAVRARCDVDAVAATVTCDDPIAEGAFEAGELFLRFWINADPETIHVTVADADSAVLFDQDVSPQYGDPFYPNGKRCGPECVGGSVEVVVP